MSIRKYFLLLICVWSGCIAVCNAQDIAALAMRARVHLYETWNFDSVAYYHSSVIGNKYCPAFAYSDYGWYLLLTGEYSEAMAMIRKAAEMSPADAQMNSWYAWALYWDNNFDLAEKWVGRALKIDPANSEALFVASLIASAQGKHSKAISLAEEAARNDPAWRSGVPLALTKAGQSNDAESLIVNISKNATANDAMLLAETYTRLEQYEEALDYLEMAYSRHHPFMPWIQYWRGLEPLFQNSRFADLVSKLNLPE